MAEVHLLGQICSGHSCWPPRPNVQGSPNVFTNGIPNHRQGDAWATHCCSNSGCHTGVLAAGSSTVFANNKQLSRTGDPISCGSFASTHSPNVFAGG